MLTANTTVTLSLTRIFVSSYLILATKSLG